MVVLCVLVYLLAVSLFLFLSKNKENIKPRLKVLKKVKPSKGFSNFFYCFKSFEVEILKNLTRDNKVVFPSEKEFLRYTLPLKNIGVDYTKKIYKLEAYKNFLIDNKKREILFLSRLKNLGVDFQVFAFVDKTENLKKIEEIFKKFKVSFNFKVMHCLDVSYPLLASINYFNVNGRKNLRYRHVAEKNEVSWLKGKVNSDINSNRICVIDKEKIFSFNNLSYANKTLEDKKSTKDVNFKLTKTFSPKLSLEVFKLECENLSNAPHHFRLCVFEKFEENVPQIFVIKNRKSKIYFENKTEEQKLMFCGLKNYKILSDKAVFYSLVKAGKGEKKQVYFLRFLNTRKFLNFDILHKDLKTVFDEAIDDLKNIKKIKVLSKNASLNHLINDYLPEQIVKNRLENTKEIDTDFENFVSLTLPTKTFEKKGLVNMKLQNFYLAKSGLFDVYFALIFFYFGVFIKKDSGLIFNEDKSLVLEDSNIYFKFEQGSLLIKNKKENLNQEIKIDGVVYSNLKFLNCSKFLGNESQIEVVF